MAKHRIKKILSGVQAIGECPCDICEHTQKCGDRRLSCQQYASFVEDGVLRGGERNPTRRLYNSVYYGAMESSWEESREIVPRLNEEATGGRIQITFRRKTA